MASPAQLIETMSLVTGVPLPTVVDIDRRLVKANLRTLAGRGRNAARMTALDAARLLTAILASPQSNVAAEAVRRYELTSPDASRSSKGLFSSTGITELARLPAGHSFVAALAALIETAGTGSLAAQRTSGAPQSPSVELFAFTRGARGRIRIAGLANGLTANVEYGLRPRTQKRSSGRRPDFEDEAGDLEQSRRVTERTLFTIAELLAKDSHHARS